ncbi:MAG TPA: hypothetical protein IAC82_00475 [Candidatus Merdivicinus intestinigallinarum]|nr:hypothetical protein [Candidatus Merdivicinus intestinigallinarum]
MSRKMILSLFLLAILAVFRPERVSANALPYQWEGAQGSEILVMEDCPLQVKGETLLFQLEPQTSGHTLQSAVTAVYSLYNPTNEPCTVPAVFPIIAAQRLENEQQVLLNGEPLPCRLLPDSEPWQEWTAGFFQSAGGRRVQRRGNPAAGLYPGAGSRRNRPAGGALGDPGFYGTGRGLSLCHHRNPLYVLLFPVPGPILGFL